MSQPPVRKTLLFLLANVPGNVPCYLNNHRAPVKVAMLEKPVKVVVGKKPQSFHCHRGLLVYYLPSFRGTFHPGFAEEEDGVITLGDDDPEIFDLVYSLMYIGRLHDELPLPMEFGHNYSVPVTMQPRELKLCLEADLVKDVGSALSFRQLFGLYIFADMRCGTVIQDMVLELVLAKVAAELQLPVDLLPPLEERLPESPALSKLIAHLISSTAEPCDVIKFREYIPCYVFAYSLQASSSCIDKLVSALEDSSPKLSGADIRRGYHVFTACQYHDRDQECHRNARDRKD